MTEAAPGVKTITLPLPHTKLMRVYQAGALIVGSLGGGAVAVKVVLIDEQDASAAEVWARLGSSSIGLAALALLTAVVAMIARVSTGVPTIEQLKTAPDADDATHAASWMQLSAEVQAWQEFRGNVVPTSVCGAAFGFATVAVVSAITNSSGWMIGLSILVTCGLWAAVFVYVWLRSQELLG